MTPVSSNIRRISDAIGFIESNLSEKLSLDAIADAAHCSKYHFHRLFSAFTGMTVHGYLQRRRLTEAAKSLVGSGRPILHIALAAGYESQQAFASVFTAMYKKPPHQFRRGAAFYPLQWPVRLTGDFAMLGDRRARWRVVRAGSQDVRAWMNLVRLVVNGFPCLCEDEYLAVLNGHIRSGSALMIGDGDTAVGAALFSPGTRRIDFLGIHPLYREAGVAEAIVREIVAAMPAGGKGVSITTYREDDKADTGQRRALQALGFVEGGLLTEFGYPTQEFVIEAL